MVGTVLGPPFSEQMGAAERLANLRREEQELKKKLTPDEKQQSIQVIQRAVQLHPDDVRLRMVLLQAYIQQRNWDPALHELQAILKVWPEDPGVILKLAIVSDGKGDAVSAEHYFRRLTEELPTSDTFSALADFLLAQNRASEALVIVDELLRQHDDLNLRAKRALILAGTDSIAASESEYRKILKQAPQFVDALIGLAAILMSRGELLDAESCAQRALTTNRTSYDAQLLLATLKLQQNSLNEAKAYAQGIIDSDSEATGAHLVLARLESQQGNHAMAIHHLREEIRIEPQLQAKQMLAWLLATSRDSTMRNGTEAVSLATELSQQAGTSPQILVTLAAAYAEAGRYDNAQSFAKQALQYAETANALEFALIIRKQLEQYVNNQPWRE